MNSQQTWTAPALGGMTGAAASPPAGIAHRAAVGERAVLPVTWAGNPWSLTGLSLLNFTLSLVTLGIYGFWGRTEVRKRIWSSVRLAGEPLEYTGTGRELFLGFLVVIGAVFVPLFLITLGAQFAFGQKSPALIAVYVGSFLLTAYLTGVALYRARRYRLSRTNWRGIRGALDGNSWAYGWTSFWTLLLLPAIAVALWLAVRYGGAFLISRKLIEPSIVGRMAQSLQTGYLSIPILLIFLMTWLWLVPWRATKLYRHITNDMTFGSQPFAFVGSARPLYARFVARWIGVVILAIATVAALYATGVLEKLILIAKSQNLPENRRPQITGRDMAWLLGILLLASFLYSIITAWYRAAQANIFAAATRFAGVPLKLNVTAGGLIWLFVTNYLLTTFSLGVLKPVAEARSAHYFVERFAFDGPVDLEAIAQSQAALGKTGEGLAQAFDVDAF